MAELVVGQEEEGGGSPRRQQQDQGDHDLVGQGVLAGVVFGLLASLAADSDAETDNEHSDSELMKDAKGAEDVPEDLLQKELLDQDWHHPQHVHDVQDCDGDDDGRHERLQLVSFPGRVIIIDCVTNLASSELMTSICLPFYPTPRIDGN